MTKIVDCPGWDRVINLALTKEEVTNFDLLLICINMVKNLGDPNIVTPLMQKFEEMFEKLATAKDEDLKPIVLSTLLLTVQEFKHDDLSKMDIFLRVHECCKRVYALDSFMITKQIITKCYMYNRLQVNPTHEMIMEFW